MAREMPSSRRVPLPGSPAYRREPGTRGGTGGLAKLLVAPGWVLELEGIGPATKASALVHRASGGEWGRFKGTGSVQRSHDVHGCHPTAEQTRRLAQAACQPGGGTQASAWARGAQRASCARSATQKRGSRKTCSRISRSPQPGPVLGASGSEARCLCRAALRPWGIPGWWVLGATSPHRVPPAHPRAGLEHSQPQFPPSAKGRNLPCRSKAGASSVNLGCP